MTPGQALKILFSDDCPMVTSVQFVRGGDLQEEISILWFNVVENRLKPGPLQCARSIDWYSLTQSKAPESILLFEYRTALEKLRVEAAKA